MYEGAEVLPFLVNVNERMRDLVEAENEVAETESFDAMSIDGTEEADSTASDSTDVLSNVNPFFEIFRPMVSETGQSLQGPRVGYSLIAIQRR